MWVKTSRNNIPTNAMKAGADPEGGPLYVGRAQHDGGLLPGKVQPKHGCCYVAHGGKEISKRSTRCELTWVDAANGDLPTGVVRGGHNDGDDLYIGRAEVGGSMAIGKVHPEHGCCYIPFGGKEHVKKEYQILVVNRIDL